MPNYTASEHSANVGGRMFTVRSLTPNLHGEAEREKRQSIERELYGIFSKYMT